MSGHLSVLGRRAFLFGAASTALCSAARWANHFSRSEHPPLESAQLLAADQRNETTRMHFENKLHAAHGKHGNFFLWFSDHGDKESSPPEEHKLPLKLAEELYKDHPNLIYVPEGVFPFSPETPHPFALLESSQNKELQKDFYAHFFGQTKLPGKTSNPFISRRAASFFYHQNVPVFHLDGIFPSSLVERFCLDLSISPSSRIFNWLWLNSVFYSSPLLWGILTGLFSKFLPSSRRGFLFLSSLAAAGFAECFIDSPDLLVEKRLIKDEATRRSLPFDLSSPKRIFSVELRNALLAFKLLSFSEMYFSKTGTRPSFLITFGAGHFELIQLLQADATTSLRLFHSACEKLGLTPDDLGKAFNRGYFFDPSSPDNEPIQKSHSFLF